MRRGGGRGRRAGSARLVEDGEGVDHLVVVERRRDAAEQCALARAGNLHAVHRDGQPTKPPGCSEAMASLLEAWINSSVVAVHS
eukprot:6196362-Pleurochrysis_carterae.AAC.2